MAPLLECQGVGFRYPGGPWLFRDLHLRVAAGRVVAVVGPSGSGKSTLLSILSRMQHPSEGVVVWSSQLRSPSWVFQQPAGIPRRACRDVVALIVQSDGRSRKSALRRADELLDAVGLTEKRNAPQRTLSGGEQQRLALAAAAATDEPLMFLDEPTGQLDRVTAGEVGAVIVDVARRVGTAVIAATHDPVVQDLSDTVVDLGDGP